MQGNKCWTETRYAGHFDVAAGREARRSVMWTGLDGRASWLRLSLIGFEYDQTKHEKLPTLLSRNAND